MKQQILIAILGAAALAAASSAAAHVSVSPKELLPGAETMVKFHIGHGCDGAPTTEVRVDIPRQLTMAHPMQVEGWSLTSKASGKRTTSISWKADGAPATTPDFEVHIGLPRTSGPVYLPVTQTCGKTVVRWNETPKGDKKLSRPAPSIQVTDHPMEAPATGAPMDHMQH